MRRESSSVISKTDSASNGCWLATGIAYGINDAGQIVGTGQINGQSHGFLLTPNTLGIALYTGLTITGKVGSSYRIDYLDAITAPNTWQVLTNFVLPSSPYLFIDPRPVAANRFYRSILLP
jgi:probable HAF family extracellular repeat protein